MNEASKEYGTALFMLALETGEKKEYFNALKGVSTIIGENPEYLEFLASPSISVTERLSAIDTAFDGKLPEHVVSFLKLMCEKGRIAELFEAIEEYFTLYDESEKFLPAKITSAVELTDDEKSRLITKLEKTNSCKINPEYITDPSLIGGITVEIDGKILDGSIRQKLREVKEVMRT